MDSTTIEIKDSIFLELERLENEEHYQSLSDAIATTINSHETWKALDLIESSIRSSEGYIQDVRGKEKTILLHYKKENIEQAMQLIKRLFLHYDISYVIESNCLSMSITIK